MFLFGTNIHILSLLPFGNFMHNWLFSTKNLLWIRTYFQSKNLTLKLIHDAYSAYLLFLDMNTICIIISLAVYAVWVQLPFCHQFFNVVVRPLPHQGWRIAVGASDAVPQVWSTARSCSRRRGGGLCGELNRWWCVPSVWARGILRRGWRWSICWRTRTGLSRESCVGGRGRGRCGMAGPEEIRPPGGKHGWRTERGSSTRDEVCEILYMREKIKKWNWEYYTIIG